MTNLRFASLWILVPPLLLCLLDMSLTLYGQSDAYWAGNYSDVNELAPSARGYLMIHPLAFVGHCVMWMAIFSSLILLLPQRLAMMVAVCVVVGHMTGSASWLVFRLGSYQACGFLFIATSVLLVLLMDYGRSPDGRTFIDWSRLGGYSWLRWVAVAILIGAPIYWSLIPH